MKAFEKWWKKQCKNNIGKMFESPRQFTEKGWRAALEMVLDKMKDETTSYTHIHIEIEQELGDG